jgi:cyclopropane-fatty-acyl-phospholipid synthase
MNEVMERVDAVHWPDVAQVPQGRLRTAVARALFTRVARRLPVRVVLPDGIIGGGGPEAPTLVLRRPADFYARLGVGGLIGFGEAYMAGDFDSDDLPAVLTVFASRLAALVPGPLQALRRWYVRRQPVTDDGTPEGARRNIHRHYDLSNELFALFLDTTMTYSAALFDTDHDSLADAQQRKIDRILDLAGVGAGSRVLEIGTGWGTLAIQAAARGATVHSVTISERQRALAIERVAQAGYGERVSIDLQDYRELTGRYDAIVSVEMFEAVGERYWPVFFDKLDRLLAPGGKVALQVITMPHDRMLASRSTYTWIQKYIFPGGFLPSVTAIEETAAGTSLRVTGQQAMGPDYARTLELWRARFKARAGEVAALGFDEIFRRMWTFYLAYSEAGFRSGYLNVRQFRLERAA